LNVMEDFILATRGSELARCQTGIVIGELQEAWPALRFRAEIIRTTGDLHPAADLTALGGSGVFTKELQRALLEGRADAAVHSLKDLPVESPAGIRIAAIARRAAAGDVLVSRHAGGVDGLPPGARIGTGSPRRCAMMLALRGDVLMASIRGNVPTRLAKAVSGEFDAVILAAAGLERLGFATAGPIEAAGQTLHVSALPGFLPAPGQGALAIEVREDDGRASEVVAALNHHETAVAVQAERAVLRALGGGCHLALGALGTVRGQDLRLEAVLFDAPGARPKHASIEGSIDDPGGLGQALARKLHGE
jgi:hydroxymethylbilane synthase